MKMATQEKWAWFSIYSKDLSTISNTLKFIMYADDTTIYFNTKDFPNDNLHKHITTELEKVHVWLKHNKCRKK